MNLIVEKETVIKISISQTDAKKLKEIIDKIICDHNTIGFHGKSLNKDDLRFIEEFNSEINK